MVFLNAGAIIYTSFIKSTSLTTVNTLTYNFDEGFFERGIGMPKLYGQLCPVARTVEILGDRWTLLIVRDLFLGKRRFKEFLESSPGLPTRVLSERLKHLEAHGLIERVVYSQHPLRAEYHLTDKGSSLEPVLAALARWGLEHRFDAKERAAVVPYIPSSWAKSSQA